MNPGYTDQLKFVLRNYSCWHFAYTLCKPNRKINQVVYFLILYKPVSLLYKLSGIMMTGLLLAGYGICIANIVYTSQSVCGSTSLGTLSRVNSIVFLVVASLVLVGSHTIIWFPICRTYCAKRKST